MTQRTEITPIRADAREIILSVLRDFPLDHDAVKGTTLPDTLHILTLAGEIIDAFSGEGIDLVDLVGDALHNQTVEVVS